VTNRILNDAELEEIRMTAGCSFGEGEQPYYIADLLHTARAGREALKMLALEGSHDSPLYAWCDDGWLCEHPECIFGRYALGFGEEPGPPAGSGRPG
jgi:hypothetical protein